MSFFRKRGSKNWQELEGRSFGDTARNRDVHGAQNLERGEIGDSTSPRARQFGALALGLLIGFVSYGVGALIMNIMQFTNFVIDDPNDVVDFGAFVADYSIILKDPRLIGFCVLAFLLGWGIINQKMMMLWRAQNSMTDSTDINTYENDQHIMLVEEVLRNYDWFPDAGAHSKVQVSSLLSHVMIDRKGIKNIELTQRHKKDIKDDSGNIVWFKGEPLLNEDGSFKQKRMPLIDTEFGQDLFTASDIPVDQKEIRTPFDVRHIPYNEKDDTGSRKDRDKQDYDMVSELINDDWEIPEYEVQRPAGAYLVDTAPVNTMVLAITRGGKGQTVIEPTIDMWTREKRQNNIVINDPKGELLVKFFVPATIRGYEVVQFNLINPLNTDIYNPLGFAAESAREGDFTKAASYIENIGDIFFPLDGADDPMWPNAANNAFKRSAFGLIDFYLEEEKRLRKKAESDGTAEKVLLQELDDMWGKVTLYNAYQLFVVLSSKKSTDPKVIKLDEAEEVKEKDYLTLFFDATARLPQNEMRKLVQNTDNALRAMAGSDKTIASVYGIALTAMSFFTDPTISTLTSGKPSQNFDAKGLSFPRRIGVRFASEYLEGHRYVGLQAVWEAFDDVEFKNKLDDKMFGHKQIIDREGWARYFFDGKFEKARNYIKLSVTNPKTNLLVKTFYFQVELTYKTDLSGMRYVTDPVLDQKIVKDGVLRELRYNRDKKKYTYRDTTVKRRYRDLLDLSKPEQLVEVPAFNQKSVKYSERPKAVFFITPPHLASYAKLILILMKQMVDVNFESSYLTKEDQKPLYKTRYMLDEVGNLQSEGQGIPALQTMLSIGLGQDQQFTLILQTLQQLRDVYGDSVDKIIQGNTENIVFLKSTDDAMIETLVKMSGTTHESRVDQKTITKDNERLLNRNEGRISYTMQTKERPVIQFNDFMFIKERNSIVIKAGSSPLWNRNETVYPMSYRLLFTNAIKLPGKEFSLQTVPTNSSAKDFDVRKNQPNFFNMLEQRLAQAKMSDAIEQSYRDAYGFTEADMIKLDQNVVSDDIMHAINGKMFIDRGDGVNVMDSATDNVAVIKESAKAQAQYGVHTQKRFANGKISRDDLISISGQINRQLDTVLSFAYSESKQYFEDSADFRVVGRQELNSSNGRKYVTVGGGANKADVDAINDASQDPNSRVYAEETVQIFYEVTDEFIKYLASLDSWDDIAGGHYNDAVSRAYDLNEQL